MSEYALDEEYEDIVKVEEVIHNKVDVTENNSISVRQKYLQRMQELKMKRSSKSVLSYKLNNAKAKTGEEQDMTNEINNLIEKEGLSKSQKKRLRKKLTKQSTGMDVVE
jgi:hypothetical protein